MVLCFGFFVEKSVADRSSLLLSVRHSVAEPCNSASKSKLLVKKILTKFEVSRALDNK